MSCASPPELYWMGEWRAFFQNTLASPIVIEHRKSTSVALFCSLVIWNLNIVYDNLFEISRNSKIWKDVHSKWSCSSSAHVPLSVLCILGRGKYTHDPIRSAIKSWVLFNPFCFYLKKIFSGNLICWIIVPCDAFAFLFEENK